MMIDFNELQFKQELKAMAKKLGASNHQTKLAIQTILDAVYKSSKRVDQIESVDQ